MKKNVLLVLTLLTITSCSLLKKTHRTKQTETVKTETHVDAKEDSSAQVTIDTTKKVVKKTTHKETTTDEIDTTIHLEGDSAQIAGLLGDTAKRDTFEANGKVIEVITNPKDKSYRVKVKDKPKDIPVKMKREKTTEDTSDSSAISNGIINSNITTSKSFSASQNTDATIKTTTKDKKSSNIPWWAVVCGIAVLVCIAGYKVYSKGGNPLKWFK